MSHVSTVEHRYATMKASRYVHSHLGLREPPIFNDDALPSTTESRKFRSLCMAEYLSVCLSLDSATRPKLDRTRRLYRQNFYKPLNIETHFLLINVVQQNKNIRHIWAKHQHISCRLIFILAFRQQERYTTPTFGSLARLYRPHCNYAV